MTTIARAPVPSMYVAAASSFAAEIADGGVGVGVGAGVGARVGVGVGTGVEVGVVLVGSSPAAEPSPPQAASGEIRIGRMS